MLNFIQEGLGKKNSDLYPGYLLIGGGYNFFLINNKINLSNNCIDYNDYRYICLGGLTVCIIYYRDGARERGIFSGAPSEV